MKTASSVAAGAATSTGTRKKRKPKRKKLLRCPRPKAEQLNPTPGELSELRDVVAQDHSPEPKPGVLSDLAAAFGLSKTEASPAPVETTNQNSMMSLSGESSGPSLAPDVEAQLAVVPDSAAADSDIPAEQLVDDPGIEPGNVAIVFNLDPVLGKKLVVGVFDQLAKKFGSDHWRVDDEDAAMIAEPLCGVIGRTIGALNEKMPDAVAGWCRTHPEVYALLGAVGWVAGTRGIQQLMLASSGESSPSSSGASVPRPERAAAPTVTTGKTSLGVIPVTSHVAERR